MANKTIIYLCSIQQFNKSNANANANAYLGLACVQSNQHLTLKLTYEIGITHKFVLAEKEEKQNANLNLKKIDFEI